MQRNFVGLSGGFNFQFFLKTQFVEGVVMKSKILSALVILLFCSNAFSANGFLRGRTITGVGIHYVGSNSLLLININGDKSSMIPCASTGRLAINSTSPHYKELVSLVFAAYLSGQNNVDIYVADTCNYFGNAQDIISIKVGDIPW